MPVFMNMSQHLWVLMQPQMCQGEADGLEMLSSVLMIQVSVGFEDSIL